MSARRTRRTRLFIRPLLALSGYSNDLGSIQDLIYHENTCADSACFFKFVGFLPLLFFPHSEPCYPKRCMCLCFYLLSNENTCSSKRHILAFYHTKLLINSFQIEFIQLILWISLKKIILNIWLKLLFFEFLLYFIPLKFSIWISILSLTVWKVTCRGYSTRDCSITNWTTDYNVLTFTTTA